MGFWLTIFLLLIIFIFFAFCCINKYLLVVLLAILSLLMVGQLKALAKGMRWGQPCACQIQVDLSGLLLTVHTAGRVLLEHVFKLPFATTDILAKATQDCSSNILTLLVTAMKFLIAHISFFSVAFLYLVIQYELLLTLSLTLSQPHLHLLLLQSWKGADWIWDSRKIKAD